MHMGTMCRAFDARWFIPGSYILLCLLFQLRSSPLCIDIVDVFTPPTYACVCHARVLSPLRPAPSSLVTPEHGRVRIPVVTGVYRRIQNDLRVTCISKVVYYLSSSPLLAITRQSHQSIALDTSFTASCQNPLHRPLESKTTV